MRKKVALLLLLGLVAKAAEIEESLEDLISSQMLNDDDEPGTDLEEVIQENIGAQTDGFLSSSAKAIDTTAVVESLQDIVKTIQEPLGDSLGAIKAWVSGDPAELDEGKGHDLDQNNDDNDDDDDDDDGDGDDYNDDNKEEEEEDEIRIEIEQPQFYLRADITQDLDQEEGDEVPDLNPDKDGDGDTLYDEPIDEPIEERIEADDRENTEDQEKVHDVVQEKIALSKEEEEEEDDDGDVKDSKSFLRANASLKDEIDHLENMEDLKELAEKVVVIETVEGEIEHMRDVQRRKTPSKAEDEECPIIEDPDVTTKSFFAKVRDFITGGRRMDRKYYDGL